MIELVHRRCRQLPAVLVALGLAAGPALAPAQQKVPVLYSSDLFHPPQDPDDTVDLATLLALPELDLQGMVLDLGSQQRKAPGAVPVKQMIALTGRSFPTATGLLHPLRYPEDKGEDQFANAHGGVNLILETLRRSREKVVIITVGSVRDVAAAYNRDPSLFDRKVSRIYINGGNSGGGDLHWNPRLDPPAYVRLLRSDLPIYWAPSFEGTESFELFVGGQWKSRPGQTYWRFGQREMFDGLAAALQNYFLYALAPKTPSQDDPIAYLKKRPQERSIKERVWSEQRHMWSTITFLDAAGRKFYRKGDSWAALSKPEPGWEQAPIYEFALTGVSIDRDIRTTLEPADAASSLRVIRILDTENYERAMISALRRILRELPISDEFR